jgi:hypothetical protein
MSKKTTFSFTETKGCCSRKGKTNKCCKTTQIKFEKVKDNYTPSNISKIPNPELSIFVFSFVQSFLLPSFQYTKSNLFLADHAPPNRFVPLIILNRTILI